MQTHVWATACKADDIGRLAYQVLGLARRGVVCVVCRQDQAQELVKLLSGYGVTVLFVDEEMMREHYLKNGKHAPYKGATIAEVC